MGLGASRSGSDWQRCGTRTVLISQQTLGRVDKGASCILASLRARRSASSRLKSALVLGGRREPASSQSGVRWWSVRGGSWAVKDQKKTPQTAILTTNQLSR